MRIPRRGRYLLVVGVLLSLACNSTGDRSAGSDEAAAVRKHEPRSVGVELPDVSLMDVDGNRIDDVLDRDLVAIRREVAAASDDETRARGQRRLDERIRVEAIFAGPISDAETRAFIGEGGSVDYVFRAVAHGFIGTLPRSALAGAATRLGPNLLLLKGARPLKHMLADATQTGRARPVWAAGFAGYAPGFSGSSTTTIAVVDTGLDGSHTDLAGRMAFFHDYSTSAEPSPVDFYGHGTHVAGIALGSGAAFGVGPGVLRYTQSGSLAGQVPGSYYTGEIHLPPSQVSFLSSATWLGGGSARLALGDAPDGNDTWTRMASTVNATSESLPYTFTPSAGMRYSSWLVQNGGQTVTSYAIANAVTTYPAVGDGFNALRGVAPGCQWAAAKVFADDGTGSNLELDAAIDDLVAQRVATNIKIMNLSVGLTPGGTLDATLRAEINTAVQSGVLVVTSAGNDGPTGGMSDPARAGLAITVGAVNSINQLTDFTTPGFATPGASEDDKPDLLAPGGSDHYALILSVDSNNSDAQTPGFADVVPNDYAPMAGTSMAAPFVSGAAALVIEALERAGTAWDFGSSSSPLFVKALLCASATETNQAREGNTNNPTLGRATAPKDHFEGYGLLNPDAAVEALSLAYTGTGLAGSTTGTRTDRRAWGRNVSLNAGTAWSLTLTMDATVDYDLYLYSAAPDAKGNPVILASSTSTALGAAEHLAYTPTVSGTGYLFIKRVSGSGAFALTGGVPGGCTGQPDGTACSDGNGCTQGDKCLAGFCIPGGPVTCAPLDQCHLAGACIQATGSCSNPSKPDGTFCNDGNACTQTDTCVAGVCTGANPVSCTPSDQCHTSACIPTTGACSNQAAPDGTSCNDNNACTKSDVCTSGVCAGTAYACAAPDQCHQAGTCNGDGTCSFASKADGTPCDDGNANTVGDVCTGGVCAGVDHCVGVTCTAQDQCHVAGVCVNHTTGACSNPSKADGVSCDDGNACTKSDVCTSGVCAGTAYACAAPDQCHQAGTCNGDGTCSFASKADGTSCDDGNANTVGDVCTGGVCAGVDHCVGVTCTAQDQCHVSGVCVNHATGACSNPSKADGVSCDDGNACTKSDVCTSGACAGTAYACAAPDQCHQAGTCKGDGTCDFANKADGTSCDDGNANTVGDVCIGGVCAGVDHCIGVACTAQDQCHLAGVCVNHSTGACSNPSKADGVSCDDGNVCTKSDVCTSGVCAGTAYACAAPDQCHQAGTCKGDGTCDFANKADGTSCDDGNANTVGDVCIGGVCAGVDHCIGVACTAQDQCHLAGVCVNHATGACSNPSQADGTSCDDGDACTQSDACLAGVCTGSAIVCTAIDECHSAGTCDSTSGACTNPAKSDGSPCSGGSCLGGTCVPEAPDASAAGQDAAAPAIDAASPALDASALEADAGLAGPDAAAAGLDATFAEALDAALENADATTLPPGDAAATGWDAASTMASDAATEAPDATISEEADGGAGRDAGAKPDGQLGPAEASQGCGCGTQGSAPSLAGMGLALLILLRRSSRRA